MRAVLILGAVSLILAGCQSTEESMYSAERVCLNAGLKPGSRAFDRCANAAYDENRRQSDQAATAVAVGAAAGVIGGAVVGAAAAQPRGYYYGWGPRCNRWGCW
ncbi:hypothetical protein [Pseudochelatococcus contaminans]|uniref:Lipoprotein n=1 Tax=Pseudochelatococcus contaminans TaxID=1538103 RepID=A0A7W6EFQ7_9HYPH|nr:hypothetical protein [Pseudochelatococcus contaminans]MBB3808895.1 hypothetical protein [Pseudochelatococcus contaminans]